MTSNKSSDTTDSVTIGFYCREKDHPTFGFLNQERNNVLNIKDNLARAAEKVGGGEPRVTVSALLVPDWDKPGNSYANEEYLGKKNDFMEKVNEVYEGTGCIVEDFEPKMAPVEKQYMHQLRSMGSSLDMIKFKAITSNQDHRHLQLDSNTKIHDYDELYAKTFGASEQKDALNASFYGGHHVTPHSKIVYTTPPPLGKIGIASELGIQVTKLCTNVNAKTPEDQIKDKGKDTNHLYTKAFSATMQKTKLSQRHKHPDSNNYYAADLSKGNDGEYRITSNVVTAVKESWSGKDPEVEKVDKAILACIEQGDTTGNPKYNDLLSAKSDFEKLDKLKNLPPIPVDGVDCDYDVFNNVVDKYTATVHPENAMAELHALSDSKLDQQIITDYHEHIKTAHPDVLPILVAGIRMPEANHPRPAITQSIIDLKANSMAKNDHDRGLITPEIKEDKDIAVVMKPLSPTESAKSAKPAVSMSSLSPVGMSSDAQSVEDVRKRLG